MKKIAMTALMASAALLAPVGVSAASADASTSPYAAQANSIGLTKGEARSMQARVDQEIWRHGGTQTAVNEVQSGGVTTTLTLPGENLARPLSKDITSAKAGRPTAHRCEYLYFCWYDGRGYTGSMHKSKTCGVYYQMVYDYEIFSYYNNQTTGTQARFFRDHTYLGSSRPAPASEPEPWADYAYVITSIRVC